MIAASPDRMARMIPWIAVSISGVMVSPHENIRAFW
jgi:hypothetical protein